MSNTVKNCEETTPTPGKYWCTAENGLDVTVNASAYLGVQCKLFITMYYL